MVSCILDIQVKAADGITPGSFAYVRKYAVINFLWWRIRWFEASTEADFYGNCAFTVAKGARYHIDANWVDASGRGKSGSIEFVVGSCPETVTLRLNP